jgi:hypothetical protein
MVDKPAESEILLFLLQRRSAEILDEDANPRARAMRFK